MVNKEDGESGSRRRSSGGSGKVVRSAIEALPETVLSEAAGAIRAESKERGLLIDVKDGQQMIIPVSMTPWVIRRSTARYFQTLFRGIRRTVNRVLANYVEDPKLQEILPLRETELAWLKASCAGGMPRPQTVFERFDTNLGPNVEEQLSTFKIIEFNAVGIGCIYLMPAATELLEKYLLPPLKEQIPNISLIPAFDYRKLLLGELQAHAKALGRPECRVGFVERREFVHGGTDEFNKIIPYFDSLGVHSIIGDPREVERNEEIFSIKGEEIDVVYRDFQLEEVVSIKTHGGSVDGIEDAFAKNRVVSTVFGEFDHKSLCELLTNPEFARYFSAQEIRAVRRRIPWTRLVMERKTAGMEDQEVDLIPYIQKNRENLVLKPNRSYGGEGVIVGADASDSAWEKGVEQAVAKPKTWVVQEKVAIAKAPMMVLRQTGKLQIEEQYVTLSVTATGRGVAFVGRCSAEPVVNISQGGGLVPVFLSV